nr:DNA-binding protein RFX2 [Columba livia]
MQSSEPGSDTAASVALHPSASSQAPVVQPVPASQQRVLVQAAGSVQSVQHVYPSQVQYVEGGEAVYTNGTIRAAYSYSTEAQIYAPSSAASYFEAQGGGAQVTTAASSPTAIPSHNMVGITMDIGGSPILSGSGAYLIHGGMENTRHSLSHTSRSSPATLEMAIENLHKNEGITSHKSSLLNSHLQWLLDNYETAEGVSLPRSSLYNHYLRHCQEHKLDPVNAASFGKLIRSVFMGLRTRRLGTRGNSKYHYYGIRHRPQTASLEYNLMYYVMNTYLCDGVAGTAFARAGAHPKPRSGCRYRPAQKVDGMAESGSNSNPHPTPEQSVAAQSQHHQQFIGEETALVCQISHVQWCPKLIWNSLSNSADIFAGTLTQAIRNFAKSLEGWLMNAMSEFPPQIVQTKVGVVSAFAQTLRRYTSLNHLAQAARAVLQNTSQINQMLSDLNRVDFANVQEQASWVCQCEEGMVQKLEQDFKLTLQQQSSLDQWASWLDNVVTQVLKHHEGSPSFPKAAIVCFVSLPFSSSMVIRDLTLRSAASFGSFHLIRLLYDEYMFYLVEHRVAQATGETPIAVMGEFGDLTSLSPTMLDKDDISDLGSEVDTDSRSVGEPLVKRERSDPGHSLQEI